MSLSSLQNHLLASLQSEDELALLDVIDSLRSQGVSHYVSLPQLVVCGDQSSGKSSVLEAISGVPFPTKIIFAPSLRLNWSFEEQRRLYGFKETLAAFDQLPILVEKVKEFKGISTTAAAFFKDRDIWTRPASFTTVDLPGLIHAENKVQTSADVALVPSMIKSYMANRRSIILAVVPAKNDYANQIVTKLAKEADWTGPRTLGIITKPDTLPVGSESEDAYVNLARNQEVEFRLGWHLLRNRDYESRNTSANERNIAEDDFFSQGIWGDFPKNFCWDRPAADAAEQANLGALWRKLGESRVTVDEQRLLLLRLSRSFQSIIKAATDGTYDDAFFGDFRSPEGHKKRLRAVIQNTNLEFAETMRTRGHRRSIVDRPSLEEPPIPEGEVGVKTFKPIVISRTDFLSEITELLKRTRGRELPGMFNPLIVSELYHDQSSPYAAWESAHTFLEMSTLHLTDGATTEALMREVIGPLMMERSKALSVKVMELLTTNEKRHPITLKEKRLESEVARRLTGLYGTLDVTALDDLPSKKIKPSTLVSALATRNEADMDLYASSEVLDCMQGYYKAGDIMSGFSAIAMKSMIDNVAIQAVENILLEGLDDLLSPAYIILIEPDMVSKIAAESADRSFQREQLSRKFTVLQAGIETCRRYVGRSVKSKFVLMCTKMAD
ncbi:MAG: hypothetical protein M1818_005916 [Claussenomyces sp. TS43310]|nr:MAG: hypothetical protein M1818_005916 [Claussenomyces sp. TS43310]